MSKNTASMMSRSLNWIAIATLALSVLAPAAQATGIPIGGFLPMVGMGLTDEFKDENATFFFQSELEPALVGNQFGAGGTPYYDLALLDTGAAVSLITSAADASFDINGAGFRGTNTLTLGGATGFLQATINDPMAMFVTGAANRTGTTPLSLNTSTFVGQSSVSLLTIPPESDLPNIVGIPFLSQYATYIRSDQPQIFQHDGQTIRTPQVEFLPLGAGGQGITRRAPMQLKSGTGVAFTTEPVYIWDFSNIGNNEIPWTENPLTPTILQEPGAFFLNVDVENEGESLSNFEFFFDTGADVTVVSELNAVRLGFDPILDEPDFTVAIVGSGGVNLEVPGFYVEEFTIQAVGGSVTANNVPVIVLDIADPTNPANIVDGIVGTNLLAGRNVVIDPNPALGGGGVGPSLYISDPVTSEFNWATTSSSAPWATGSNWNPASAPDNLGIANVRHVSGGNQTAILAADTTVWELNVSGSGGQEMTVQINSGHTLTTFAGISIETDGVVQMTGSTIDTQNIEILGGRLTGSGLVKTGSGPIPGQVENRIGTISPGNGVGTLEIEGRFSNGVDGTLEVELGGLIAGTTFDQLVVDGPAALAGILDISLVDLGGGVLDPQVGDTFEILTASEGVGGSFDSLLLPAGYDWFVRYNANSVELAVTIPGDFDGDLDADNADFLIWESSYGDPGGLSALNFLEWQSSFGATAGVPVIAHVPEPNALTLCCLAMASGILARRRPLRKRH